MKRIVIAVLVMGLLVPFAGTRALGADPPDAPVIVQGAGLAAAGVVAGNVDPNVDFWPMYSESSIDNDSSHGLSGAVWPGFLVDAFFWLYGYQPMERAGFGISESQWPNPPNSSKASSSGFLVSNIATGCASFFGPEPCAQFLGSSPISGGNSASRSAHFDSSGFARGLDINIPGVLEATEARSRTSSRYVDGRTLVESVFAARDVTIGGQLHIDTIVARSLASATGVADTSKSESTLKIVGAKLGDQPVVIDDQGMHTSGDETSRSLGQPLASEGIEVLTTQGRTKIDSKGEFVDASTGGLFIRILRQRAEETLPTPLVEQKDAACAAAADNPLNQEITRIRVDQPNPLYGQLPVPGVPQRAQLEQSVPPPFSCPFLNRDFGVTLALGLTDSSARLSPLATLGEPLTILNTGLDGAGPVTRTTFVPGTAAIPATQATPVDETVLAAAPQPNRDGAKRVQALYGLFALLIALAVGGRFVLKFASAP